MEHRPQSARSNVQMRRKALEMLVHSGTDSDVVRQDYESCWTTVRNAAWIQKLWDHVSLLWTNFKRARSESLAGPIESQRCLLVIKWLLVSSSSAPVLQCSMPKSGGQSRCTDAAHENTEPQDQSHSPATVLFLQLQVRAVTCVRNKWR
jgi:hypothetical protein